MSWLKRLWQRGHMEQQLEKELRFHLEQHTKDLIARGLNPDDARRQARMELGGPEQVKEECRDARGTRWAEDLLQDFRYALRTMRQRPGFAAVALLTLALGTGATTVMFTVVNGVLLKPLPFRQVDRLVAVHGWSEGWDVSLYGEQNLAYLDYLDCKREVRSIEIAGWLYNNATISRPGDPEYVDEKDISSNLFPLLGVSVFRGRAFLPEEDRAGGAPVAILGYSFWQHHFGGNPDAIGMPLALDTKQYTIVGIAPPDFRPYGGDEADVYTPLGQNTAKFLQNRRAHPITTVARLKPGATLAQANTDLALIGKHIAEQHPDTNKQRTFIAEPLRPRVGNVRSTLWLLLGAVGLVLLIACVNVASLLLARAVSRERELAMRAALGATRGRLARQCLTESAVLGICGGVLGVILARFGIRPFVAFWPGTLPRAEDVQLDWRVLAFAIVVSVASGLFFGLAPALRTHARELEQALRAGSRTLIASSRGLHSGFVISEIALALVLLIAAGMMGRTMLRLLVTDPGLDIRNILTARVALSPFVLQDPARIRAAWQDVIEHVHAIPGVEAVTTVDTVPLRAGNNPIGYWTTPTEPPEKQKPITLANSVSPDYLKVMRIPLRRGRFFTDQDRMSTEHVAVIDEVMAHEAFGGQDPIGKHLWIGLGSDPLTVIGVVGHVRYWGVAADDQARVRAQTYYPFAQVPDPLQRRWSELMSIAVRTSVPPLNVVAPLRRALRGSAGDQVLYDVQTMERISRETLAQHRFLLLLFGIFAGLALILACIGIYGVMAYLTTQRVPEFGVRMALGANSRDVLRMVLRESLGMILFGVGVGLCGAMAAGRLLAHLVAGMRATGLSTFVATISVLVFAALFASFLPARRASRVDPMRALRQE